MASLSKPAEAQQAAPTGTITARQVIERIQKNVGVPWQGQTVDTFKAGNPDTRVMRLPYRILCLLPPFPDILG
jgi:hypothetical protein